MKYNKELIDDLMKDPPDFLKFECGDTLQKIIEIWWIDTFTLNSALGVNDAIGDLIDRIENFLPKEQNSSGSQNAYVDCACEGYNDAIKKIKSKLRNKK
jgi:hypothetical protein